MPDDTMRTIAEAAQEAGNEGFRGSIFETKPRAFLDRFARQSGFTFLASKPPTKMVEKARVALEKAAEAVEKARSRAKRGFMDKAAPGSLLTNIIEGGSTDERDRGLKSAERALEAAREEFWRAQHFKLHAKRRGNRWINEFDPDRKTSGRTRLTR